MKTYYYDQLSPGELEYLCKRKAIDMAKVDAIVEKIISQVKKDGDSALIELTKKLDGVGLDSLQVPKQEIEQAISRIPKDVKKAYSQAVANIEKFHKTQIGERETVETMPGVVCYSEMRPVEKVGLYIPGGSAPLPSTVLMLAIPANLAGCREIILCTPPQKEGNIADSVLFAADLCGIKKIYKVGGAQAVAAMAYGTQTLPKVYKIFGPGNQYVTAAKMQVSVDLGGASIDMPAGPTELLVIADDAARADFVASDLLSQAEHGPDSEVVLVCTSQAKAKEVLDEVKAQISSLPRKEIARSALKNSFSLIVKDTSQAISFSNDFAPEHLILNVKDAEAYVNDIANAGSVFLGEYSPESAGDYASGTNHSLPTYGYARTYSGVSVTAFQKRVTFQKLSREGIKNIAPVITAMAAEESLDAHKRAAEIRL